MNTVKQLFKGMVLAAVIGFFGVSNAQADFETLGHQVTVAVPEVLSITADTDAFTLTFASPDSGAETNSKTVVYSVSANDMGQADGDTAINANLDALYDGVDFKAQVGSYNKIAGNTELAAANAGFVTMGTSNLGIAKKANSEAGTDGKLLEGTLPITYKAVATEDLPFGAQAHYLFITLTTR